MAMQVLGLLSGNGRLPQRHSTCSGFAGRVAALIFGLVYSGLLAAAAMLAIVQYSWFEVMWKCKNNEAVHLARPQVTELTTSSTATSIDDIIQMVDSVIRGLGLDDAGMTRLIVAGKYPCEKYFCCASHQGSQ